MDFLVLLGPPGAGKGTVSRLLQSRTGFEPLSTGEAIRREMADPLSEVGQQARPFMDRGDYIPDAMALDLFFSILKSHPESARLALDGFPRTVPQAEAFLPRVTEDGHRVLGCVAIDVASAIAEARMLGRRVCVSCRTPYHLVNRPPEEEGVCDRCGGKLIPREDDDPERLGRRVNRYQQRTRPLLEWLRAHVPCLDLDGAGDPDSLADQIDQWVKNIEFTL